MSDKIVTNEELGSSAINEVTGTKDGNKNALDVYVIGGLESLIGGTIPAGGTTGQHLAKSSSDPYDTEWVDAHEVPAGGTTGQVLAKVDNDDYDVEWIDVTTSPGGSDSQVQFNDGGVFGGEAAFIYDKTNDSLNIQTTLKQHPFHANASTGQTINNVATASVVQTTETLNASPTGTITLIAEFTNPSGCGANQNTVGSGYTANGQTIDYQIYAAIYDGTNFFKGTSFEAISFSDPLNDSSAFSIELTFPAAFSHQTHWYIEKQVSGGGFNDSALHPVGSNFEDSAFSGTASASSWPTQYQLTYTTPTAPSSDSAQEINIGSGGLFEDGTTYMWEIRSAANVGSLYYCEPSGLAGNSFTDANSATTFDLEINWTPGTGDEQVIRISIDGGSSWSYYFVGSMAGQFIHTGSPDSSDAFNAWDRDIATAEIEYAFKCYARTLSPSGLAYYFNSTADTYYGTITTPNTPYIFKHTFTGLTGAGGKVLADYNVGITNGKDITSDFIDAGYSSWADGTDISAQHYGYTGTAQVREYKLYGYSGSLLIYSATAYTVASSNTGGYKYNTVSFSFPSGVTVVKITRGINGAAHNAAALVNSPTTSIIDDMPSTSLWSQSTTVTPNTAVPTTVRFDHTRSSLSQSTDNLLICDTTGSGTRYPSIAFGVAANANTGHSGVQARIATNSSTGRMVFGANIEAYSGPTYGSQTFNMGHSYDYNLGKSSTIHTTFYAGHASDPVAYFYSAGDSNRGTAYFGQQTSSFGTNAKVCIAPPAGGTTGLHFRRTSGFSGDNILIDEAGSFKAGWGAAGRMFLNASGISSTTYLLVGGTGSGSQVRLAAGSIGTVEGDISNSSTQKCITAFVDGIQQYDSRTLFVQTASGVCANTTTETNISSTGVGTLTLPSNFFVVGKTLKIKAFGFHSSTGTPNLTIKIKLGSTVICTTGAHATHGGSNHGIEIDALITCRTTGGSGTVFAQGVVHDDTDHIPMVNTTTSTISTTSSQALTITAQWGTASASNTITLTNFVLKVEA